MQELHVKIVLLCSGKFSQARSCMVCMTESEFWFSVKNYNRGYNREDHISLLYYE